MATKAPNEPVLKADLAGRTVIVVGANTGIGLEAAKHFARMGLKRLICTCRDEQKCAQITELIREETGLEAVEGWVLELGVFASVKAFVDRFDKDGGELDFLVCNAAQARYDYTQTIDGHETTVQVNHLSGSLLTLLLLPRLLQTAQRNGTVSRVVVVSSGTHALVTLGKDVVPSDAKIIRTLSDKEYSTPDVMKGRYPTSKLLNVLFTRALQARVSASAPLVFTAVDPDFCVSQLRRYVDESQFAELLKTARTSEEGSRQLIYAALGPSPNELDNLKTVAPMRGAYVAHARVTPPAEWVTSDEGQQVQKRIWDETLDLLMKVDSRVARSQELF